MSVKLPKLKIMVASTVYEFQDQLEQICSTLRGFGYDVLNSHIKTIPVHPGKSNMDNCLEAVKDCDVFLGIVRPQYGTGIIGARSITHEEMRKAIELKKPRWFVAHRDIKVARVLLKQYMKDEHGNPNPAFSYVKNNIMDDVRVIELYNETILDSVPAPDRIGHWVEEYFGLSDILTCVETQFRNVKRVRDIVAEMERV